MSWTDEARQRSVAVVPRASELRASLERLEFLARSRDATEIAALARMALEPLDRGEVRVVVLGQFKRGKTSVVNALLRAPVLPTGIVPLTSVAALVRYGEPATAEIVFEDGRRERVAIDSLGAYVTELENPGNKKRVSRVEIAYPSPVLEQGLVLVDTPGVGSVHTDTTDRALAFLPHVDAAIVVLSPDPPISQTELDYVQRVARHTPHLFFVFNKVDLYPEPEWREALEYSRRVIAGSLEKAAEQVEILPLSAQPAFGASAGRLDGAFTDGVDELARRLRAFVAARGGEVSLRAGARRLERLARAFLGLLDLEESALRTPTDELERWLQRLEEQLKELRRRRKEIGPGLQSTARRLADDAEESLLATARTAAPSLATALHGMIRDAKGVPNSRLASRVNQLIESRVQDLFDAWQRCEGKRIVADFQEAMARDAAEVEAAIGGLRRWIAEEFGIQIPPTPQQLELAESKNFYYSIEGALPRLTIDIFGLWLLPRPLLRWRLSRRAGRMALEELERNAGRVRGELLYRFQETARQFNRRLEQHAEAAEDALRSSLERALEQRQSGAAKTASALREIHAVREELLTLLPDAEADMPPRPAVVVDPPSAC